MLKQILETRETKNEAKAAKFQVIFLGNDSRQQVEVYDVKKVDFSDIETHLERGESVFITSKSTQKINGPKPCRTSNRYLKTRMVSAFVAPVT